MLRVRILIFVVLVAAVPLFATAEPLSHGPLAWLTEALGIGRAWVAAIWAPPTPQVGANLDEGPMIDPDGLGEGPREPDAAQADEGPMIDPNG